MIALTPVVLVEGKYDRNKLLQIFDATVLTTGGFQIFRDPAQQRLLRRLAVGRGLLVFTDPDGAGFVIRNFVKNIVRDGTVYHAYIPDLPGRERRKAQPSKEGLLGVEGVPDAVIVEAVRRSGALDAAQKPRAVLTKADLYELGLSGRTDSAARRRALCRALDLPEKLSANALLDVLCCVTDLPRLRALAEQWEDQTRRPAEERPE